MKSPIEAAAILATHYGHQLDRPVMYTQGVSLSGRLRLHELDSGITDPSGDIAGIVSEYAASPSGIFTAEDGTANFAGICWADELAEATGDDRYLEILRSTAELYGPSVEEGPLDPDVRVEDFFFAATVLGRAFRSTGDAKYTIWLADFLESADTLQPNDLWWHCKASPFFWGRGNGFAALGFAEALTYLPDDHSSRAGLVKTHVRHLASLTKHQDVTGMWPQIVDMPAP